MRATNPYAHDVGISRAIKDVTDLRAVFDSLYNNDTPIVCEKQEFLGACETAWQGAIREDWGHLDQYYCPLFFSSATFTPRFDRVDLDTVVLIRFDGSGREA